MKFVVSLKNKNIWHYLFVQTSMLRVLPSTSLFSSFPLLSIPLHSVSISFLLPHLSTPLLPPLLSVPLLSFQSLFYSLFSILLLPPFYSLSSPHFLSTPSPLYSSPFYFLSSPHFLSTHSPLLSPLSFPLPSSLHFPLFFHSPSCYPTLSLTASSYHCLACNFEVATDEYESCHSNYDSYWLQHTLGTRSLTLSLDWIIFKR